MCPQECPAELIPADDLEPKLRRSESVTWGGDTSGDTSPFCLALEPLVTPGDASFQVRYRTIHRARRPEVALSRYRLLVARQSNSALGAASVVATFL